MRAQSMLILAACVLVSTAAWPHCEIPCGIYGDDLRFSLIEEHITTIEKSMQQIVELSGDVQNANQRVRWIDNKEHHADQIREIVTQYFMTQRLKPVDEGDAEGFAAYTGQLVLLHKMLRAAMKCKQTTDLADVETLRRLAHDFKRAYGKK